MAQDEKNRHQQDPTVPEKYEFVELQVQEHDQEAVVFDTRTIDPAQSSVSLPSPATTPSKPQRVKIPAAAIIPVWIILSSAVILYNNHVYNTIGFHYPVFLVTWHLTFAVSLSLLSSSSTTDMSTEVDYRHQSAPTDDQPA